MIRHCFWEMELMAKHHLVLGSLIGSMALFACKSSGTDSGLDGKIQTPKKAKEAVEIDPAHAPLKKLLTAKFGPLRSRQECGVTNAPRKGAFVTATLPQNKYLLKLCVTADPGAVQPGNFLLSGTAYAHMLPGRILTSANGEYQLTFQSDRNLVLQRVKDQTVLWSTETQGADKKPNIVMLQKDGNLVAYKTLKFKKASMYDDEGNRVERLVPDPQTPVWAPASNQEAESEHPANGVLLLLQNDGNLAIYPHYAHGETRRTTRAVWATNTCQGCTTQVVTNAVGGNGGPEEAEQRCATFVRGFRAYTGDQLDSGIALCEGESDASGDIAGGGGPDARNVMCPAGSIVTGMRGHTEPYKRVPIVGSLVLECTSRETLRGRTSQSPMQVDVFDGAVAREKGVLRQCPSGYAARAFRVKHGDKVDGIKLVCEKF